jgi:hypothetical protein
MSKHIGILNQASLVGDAMLRGLAFKLVGLKSSHPDYIYLGIRGLDPKKHALVVWVGNKTISWSVAFNRGTNDWCFASESVGSLTIDTPYSWRDDIGEIGRKGFDSPVDWLESLVKEIEGKCVDLREK